jgi:hypothetical protein
MKDEHSFDKKKNVNRIAMGLYILAALLVIIDLFSPNHPFFPWEGYPGFYAAYGFIAYVVIVFGSSFILYRLLKRKEDYYD